MAKNQRRFPRVRARGVAAHLRTEHGRTACQVENVSMGGIFVRTDRLEEVGAEIFVDLVSPGWKKQLSLSARITTRIDALDSRISKRMPGMGLQFIQLDDKQHDRLASLLRELGAPEEDLQITLDEDSTELELRALELESERYEEPLDPQPQPVWQQVQMAAADTSALHSLVDDIEGVLRDANLPPPGPVFLDPEPAPARVSSGTLAADPGLEARLMMQIRGLVMQLS